MDRDGVINICPQEHNYVTSWSKFTFSPDIFNLLQTLRKKYQFIVISNQQGIAKGMMTEADLKEISDNMVAEFKKHNIEISALYFCPHHKDEDCTCRKPKPGLIIEALSDFSANPDDCMLIGDSGSDIEAGKAAGIKINHLLTSDSITNLDFEKITSVLEK